MPAISPWLRHCFLAWLGILLLGAGAQAQTPGRNAIEASLIAESNLIAPGGSVTLALVMRPAKGWHGYWQDGHMG